MARKTVLTSDLTGVEIIKQVVVKADVNGTVFLLDVDESEEIVQTIKQAGRQQKRRGRKAKTAA